MTEIIDGAASTDGDRNTCLPIIVETSKLTPEELERALAATALLEKERQLRDPARRLGRPGRFWLRTSYKL